MKKLFSQWDVIFKSLIVLIVIVKVLFTGILYDPDSLAFTTIIFSRSPGYMLFASFFTSVFGNYFEIPLLIAQLIFNLSVCLFATQRLTILFNLNSVFSTIVLVIFITPLVSTYLTANKILTEALTYPLFLLFNVYTLQFLIQEKNKYFTKALLVLFLLIITRNQFLAMVPVLIILISFLWYKSKHKKYLFLLLTIICLPVVTTFFERTFNYIAFGTFTNMPGAHMPAAAAFFVADEKDVQLFTSDKEVQFFTTAMAELKRKQLLASSLPETDYYILYGLYQTRFSRICNQTLHEIAVNQFTDPNKSRKDRLLEAEQLFKSMFWPLLIDNYKQWTVLYIQNIRYALGNTKMFLLYFSLLITGVFLLFKNPRNKIGLFFVFTTLCTFCSLLLLGLVSHSENRYIFYHHWTLFIALLLLIDQYIKATFPSETSRVLD
ncbi:hypothetical protein NBT05_18025 [Aquimarina sp. ERC-38]|uniref:hypothetical protein n=1 Tax=Aquimarina sp. ERC-38 TaxID=2949996 RepID=UPI002245A12A|nr:hypothetical protein [Aquimarina sp. ERC-38]UZO80823.1 hypothetical protein NBT05_18025 [Aquimarina sp. ERC-38]